MWHWQALIRFWIVDHRSTVNPAGGSEVSYRVLVGAEAMLNGTAAELPEGAAVKPPSAVIAAVSTGGRILVAEFRVTQVAWCIDQTQQETSYRLNYLSISMTPVFRNCKQLSNQSLTQYTFLAAGDTHSRCVPGPASAPQLSFQVDSCARNTLCIS